VTVEVNDRMVASQTYAAPGTYVLSSAPLKPDGDAAKVRITVDKDFSVPGDDRRLGIILTEVGFR
jgi:hypothetical protein